MVRAHCINSRRILLSPRLRIPNRLALPLVLYWRGGSPMDAAKSQLQSDCFVHVGYEYACGARAKAWNRQEPLAHVTIGSLQAPFLFDLTHLFIKVLIVRMQAFQCRTSRGGRIGLGPCRGQALDDC